MQPLVEVSDDEFFEHLLAFRDQILACDTLDDAFAQLTEWLKARALIPACYGFTARPQNIRRADGVLRLALSEELQALYFSNGGMMTDPVANTLGLINRPFIMDLEALGRDESIPELYRRHPLRFGFMDSGMRQSWSVPFFDLASPGLGAISVFPIPGEPFDASRLAASRLQAVVNVFHQAAKANKSLPKHFGLTPRERDALAFMARGLTAQDLSEQWKVSRRSVEMSLARARKKLKARTTAEALYKAVVYGLFD